MTALRIVNDLPPRWDGFAVVWSDWNAGVSVICPKMRPEACGHCGSNEAVKSASGLVADDPEMSPTDVAENHRRIKQYGHKRIARRAWYRLSAFRCPGCGHDQVRDGDEWWDLDSSDYGDSGSFGPEPLTLFEVER